MPRKLKPSRLDRLTEEARRWLWDNYPELTIDELLAGLEEKFNVREKRSTLGHWLQTRRGRELDAVREHRLFARELAGACLEQANAQGVPPDQIEAMKERLANTFFLAMRKAQVDPIAASRERREWERLELRKQQLVQEQERLELHKQEQAAEREKLLASGFGSPRDLYLRAAQDLIKKLRTRKDVRGVLDPIREELIQELSHAAEAFEKSLETRPA